MPSGFLMKKCRERRNTGLFGKSLFFNKFRASPGECSASILLCFFVAVAKWWKGFQEKRLFNSCYISPRDINTLLGMRMANESIDSFSLDMHHWKGVGEMIVLISLSLTWNSFWETRKWKGFHEKLFLFFSRHFSKQLETRKLWRKRAFPWP